MRKGREAKINRILTLVGIILIISSAVLTIFSLVNQNRAEKNAYKIVNALYANIPNVRPGNPDDRINMSMPMMEIDGVNYSAIVEIPVYGTILPVCGKWDMLRINSFPCCYTGSMYDGSLIIGGSDARGQFDFMKIISNNDLVYVTDMTGLRFSYQVYDIDITNDVSLENLTKDESDLVLFSRNSYSLEYTIVKCRIK